MDCKKRFMPVAGLYARFLLACGIALALVLGGLRLFLAASELEDRLFGLDLGIAACVLIMTGVLVAMAAERAFIRKEN